MPADVSLVRSPYWLNWDLFFGLSYLAVLLVVVVDQSTGPGGRVGSAVVLTLLFAWYAGFGRGVIRAGGSPARASVFVAGVAVLFCVAVGFNQTNSLALFVVCPLVGLSLDLRPAIIVVAALNLAPAAIGGVLRGGFLSLLPIYLLSLAFSMVSTVYIDRIIRTSTERAELITQLEASRAEVGRLSHAAGVAAERARLAGEIHDTLAQGFASIITLLQAADSAVGRDEGQVRHRLDLALRAARDNLGEARALVEARGPDALASGSLDQAVRRIVSQTSEELGVPAQFTVDGTPTPLSTAVEVVLLRAVQEALSNVRKHAAAGNVVVQLSYLDSSVRLVVRDDGRGFVHDGPSSGFGLPGMRNRASQVGGSLSVASSQGAGTEVRLEVPL